MKLGIMLEVDDMTFKVIQGQGQSRLSTQGYAFGGSVYISPHLWSQIQKNLNFGGVSRIFKRNVQNIQTFILSKIPYGFQPNLAH